MRAREVGRRGVSLNPTRPALTLSHFQTADRAQFESVLAQAEGAYAKILESAQALVAVLRVEAGHNGLGRGAAAAG